MKVPHALFLLLLSSVCYAVLELQFVRDAQERGALCNDGSPSGFYFEAGSGTGANIWLIHQVGGYACWEEAACLERAKTQPYLVSSKTWTNTTSLSGIFSSVPSESPTFCNANKVYMMYCSSDYWAGIRGPIGSEGIDAWYFAGHNITKAVTEDLVLYFGMNTTETEILFTGCSAGGKGVFVNVDWVRSYLPFTPAKYLGFSDEGWSADFPLTTGAYWYQFLTGTDVWQSLPNARCNAAHQHPFLCYFGSVSLPYITTPTVVHAEQYDIVQFGEDCSCSFNPKNQTMMGWMEDLRNAFVSSFRVLQPPHSLFSPACATHCISLGNTFTTITINGVSLAQHLAKFWNNNGNANANIPNVVDTCPQFNCSVGCP